ncbi:NAD-dependent epimerase/dehydratase family protein [Pseudomonas gingeri]|uniref:NAD-dependent epimerase/dehydratase family protein n=1 Tax=Pseudomonas gingeri TaxID=117681 RepID=UPI0015A3EA93|nr:NAD-dependent epimerase/dehydratase family protein [Pseudomonas gingeri]NWE50588.1 NAD-dependent dehydratase [Pseudomonas gingeri]
MKVLILGATGQVGRHVLEQALANERIEQVIAPTRRALAMHPRLLNPVSADLHQTFADIAGLSIDAMICTMGTTIAKAGSKEAFREVDYVLPIKFAEWSLALGAKACAIISSPGASLSIPLYYCQVKGELERDIQGIGLRSLTIIRPGMIGGSREEFRPAERLIMPLAALLRPILPRGLWINPPANIARVMIEAVCSGPPGVHLLTSRDLV